MKWQKLISHYITRLVGIIVFSQQPSSGFLGMRFSLIVAYFRISYLPRRKTCAEVMVQLVNRKRL